MKKFIFALLIFFVASNYVHAESTYVLPYPGPMPGNAFYKVGRLTDTLYKYWYWGTLGGLKYERKLADKYLVEAKVLFEYKQYVLGLDALHRSDVHVPNICSYYVKAKSAQVQTEALRADVQAELLKHEEVLIELTRSLPESFYWQDEYKPGSQLMLAQEIQKSQKIRSDCMQNIH